MRWTSSRSLPGSKSKQPRSARAMTPVLSSTPAHRSSSVTAARASWPNNDQTEANIVTCHGVQRKQSFQSGDAAAGDDDVDRSRR